MGLNEVLERVGVNLAGRIDGPLHLRILMQPLVAAVMAVRAGVRDAREGRPAFLWAVLHKPDHRRDILRRGWRDIGKVFTLAVVFDVVYQLIVFHRIYPLETLLVAVILAALPYVLLCGPVNRLVRWFESRK